MEDWRAGGFGLYLHWPFCQSKCPYCDFNSHVAQAVDQKHWLQAYRNEIARLAAETSGRVLNTVFFGGGTPSLMDPDLVAAVIDAIRSSWPMANDPEITLEANPGSVEVGRFAAYRQAGVTRVSMGVQALNDADLRRLGRLHTADEAMRAFEIARGVFERVSFDLIYARQDQSLDDWRAELRRALAMAVDHLSLYQLTVEAGTPFADRLARGGLRGLPDENRAADLYDATQDICSAHGMASYEVSNHARPGAESRHNLIYWRGGDYVGIGPGAHGRLTLGGRRWATECPKSPATWLAAALRRDPAEKPRQALTGPEHAAEYLLMSLRLTEGTDLRRLELLAGALPLPSTVDDLTSLGLLEADPTHLRATPAGRLVLNALISKLAADLPE